MQCRLCISPKTALEKGVLPAEIIYDVILLFSKEDSIVPGSVIEVQQKFGKVPLLFESVGEMVCYSTHNEIALKRKTIT